MDEDRGEQGSRCTLFRRVVKARCERWEAGRAIEKRLRVELEVADAIDHRAAGIDNAEDASAIDATDAVSAIIVNVIR